MVAWYEIGKFRDKRKQQRQAQLEETFINIWTEGEIFSSKQQSFIHWKFTPDVAFLIKDLAEEVMVLRDQRRRQTPNPPNTRATDMQRENAINNTQTQGQKGPTSSTKERKQGTRRTFGLCLRLRTSGNRLRKGLEKAGCIKPLTLHSGSRNQNEPKGAPKNV